jgi:leucyl/phenylalanyl-tRNA--protein transferase
MIMARRDRESDHVWCFCNAIDSGAGMPRRLRFRPENADEHGLVAIGGDLAPETLLDAYRHGVFPWYDSTTPICWWSPDPRAILPLDGLHVSRRLARTVRTDHFQVTINRDFAGVIRGCADRPEGTWITEEMMDAYERLHAVGHAHSVEIWRGEWLAGGVYGVAIGGLFAGESMFHRQTDASKVALGALVERIRERNLALLDVQFLTPHLARMGAVEIPRAEYLERLDQALTRRVSFV